MLGVYPRPRSKVESCWFRKVPATEGLDSRMSSPSVRACSHALLSVAFRVPCDLVWLPVTRLCEEVSERVWLH